MLSRDESHVHVRNKSDDGGISTYANKENAVIELWVGKDKDEAGGQGEELTPSQAKQLVHALLLQIERMEEEA